MIQEQEGAKEAARVFGHVLKRLQAHDSRLFLFLCDRDEEMEGELRKGFYYVGRHNEDGTTALWEVRNPDGSYREPDEAVVQAFLRGDANSSRDPAWERRKQRERDEKLKEHRRAHAEEERLYRLREQADFRFRLQIPVGDALDKLKGKA